MKTITNERQRGCGFRRAGGLYMMADGVGSPCGALPVAFGVCPCCGQGVKPALGWTWVEPARLFPPITDGSQVVDSGERIPTICQADHCAACPISHPPESAGLLWIGGAFYKTPEEWTQEAIHQGVSRRVASIPQGFVLGSTWVFVGHRKAATLPCPDCQEGVICQTCAGTKQVRGPAIFHVFRPTRLEYILNGLEEVDAADLLDKGRAQGITDPDQVADVLGPQYPATVATRDAIRRLARMEARGITLVHLVRTDGLDGVHKAKGDRDE